MTSFDLDTWGKLWYAFIWIIFFKVRNAFWISSHLVWYQTQHSLVNKQFDQILTILTLIQWFQKNIFFQPIFEFYSTRQLIWYQPWPILGIFLTSFFPLNNFWPWSLTYILVVKISFKKCPPSFFFWFTKVMTTILPSYLRKLMMYRSRSVLLDHFRFNDLARSTWDRTEDVLNVFRYRLLVLSFV